MRTAFLALAAAGLMATAAAAQTASATLADGRTFTASAGVGQCRAPTVNRDPSGAVGLDYACTVPDLDGGAARVEGVGAVILLPASQASGSAEAFLRETQQEWWPSVAAADLAPLAREAKRTANGEVRVICAHRDNIEALNGDAICVVDQPGLQVIIAGQSTMAFTADNVVDGILAGSTLR